MNKIIIIGSLGKDPEMRTVASGNTVSSFSVAVNERKGGKDITTWFRVSAWNKLGDICQRFLAKGRKVCVVGSVSVSTYTGKDGATRFSLDVFAEDVEFLGPRTEDAAPQSDANDTAFEDELDDSLPF